jgi:hypothetical protein
MLHVRFSWGPVVVPNVGAGLKLQVGPLNWGTCRKKPSLCTVCGVTCGVRCCVVTDDDMCGDGC